MTEYEYASLFAEFIQAGNAAMTNLMTVVFAFLVAAYLVADKLDRLTAALGQVIYALFAFGYTNEVIQAYSDFARLGVAINARHGAGLAPELGWLGPATGHPGAMTMIPVMVGVMTIGSVLVSLWFFAHQRRKGRQGG